MGAGGSPTRLESLALSTLGFPLVLLLGEVLPFVALNSLTWGLLLGFVIPAVWRAYRQRKVAAQPAHEAGGPRRPRDKEWVFLSAAAAGRSVIAIR